MTIRQTKNWYYVKLDWEEMSLKEEIKALGKGNWFFSMKTKEWGVRKTNEGIALIMKFKETEEALKRNQIVNDDAEDQKKYWRI